MYQQYFLSTGNIYVFKIYLFVVYILGLDSLFLYISKHLIILYSFFKLFSRYAKM